MTDMKNCFIGALLLITLRNHIINSVFRWIDPRKPSQFQFKIFHRHRNRRFRTTNRTRTNIMRKLPIWKNCISECKSKSKKWQFIQQISEKLHIDVDFDLIKLPSWASNINNCLVSILSISIFMLIHIKCGRLITSKWQFEVFFSNQIRFGVISKIHCL